MLDPTLEPVLELLDSALVVAVLVLLSPGVPKS